MVLLRIQCGVQCEVTVTLHDRERRPFSVRVHDDRLPRSEETVADYAHYMDAASFARKTSRNLEDK